MLFRSPAVETWVRIHGSQADAQKNVEMAIHCQVIDPAVRTWFGPMDYDQAESLGLLFRLNERLISTCAKYGRLDVVKHLIPTDIDRVEKELTEALFAAADHGHLPIIKYIASLVPLHDKRRYGSSLIDRACSKDQHEVVKYLVDHGAPLTHSTLLYACRRNDVPLATRTISSGVVPDVWVLKKASEHGAIDTLRLLLSTCEWSTHDLDKAVNAAADYLELETLKCLVEEWHVPIDIYAHSGFTFRNACMCGHLDMVKYLVAKGVNINRRGGSGYRLPIDWARAHGRAPVVAFLRSVSR